MLRFLRSTFASKFSLKEEMHTSISEVYKMLLEGKKIDKKEVLALEVAPNTYLSIVPEPQWIIGKKDTLSQAIERRKKAYASYVETYNSTLKTVREFIVAAPHYRSNPSLPPSPPLPYNPSKEKEILFFGMLPIQCVLYNFGTAKEEKTAIALLTGMEKKEGFEVHIIKTIMEYADTPSLSSNIKQAEKATEENKEEEKEAAANEEETNETPKKEKTKTATQNELYLRAIQNMARKDAMRTLATTPYPIPNDWFTSAFEGKRETVVFYLQHGIDIEMETGEGETALILAAYKGHTDIVALLLQQNANTATEKGNMKGCTALFLAAAGNHIDIVKHLLQHGVTQADKDTAFQAIPRTQNALIELFLKHGITQKIKDETFIRAIEFSDNQPTMALLLQYEITQAAKDQAFLEASKKDDIQLLQLLLHHKITPKIQEQAENIGKFKLIKFLLQENISQAEKDAAFAQAVEQNQFNVVAFFLKEGVTQEKKEQLFLNCLAIPGTEPAIKLLLDSGITYATKEEAFIRSAHYRNNRAAMAIFLEHEISQEKKDAAFRIAASRNDLQVVQLLLEKGITQRIIDLVFLEAILNKKFSILLALLQKGISPETEAQGHHSLLYSFLEAKQEERNPPLLSFQRQERKKQEKEEQKNLLPEIIKQLNNKPYKEAIELFFQHGATPYTVGKALAEAVKYPGQEAFALQLLGFWVGTTAEAKDHAFLEAINNNRETSFIGQLLQFGIGQAARDAAYAVAAIHKAMPTVELLLQTGITQEGKDDALLKVMPYNNRLSMMEFLLQQGITDKGKGSAYLEAARYKDRTEKAKLLLQYKITEKTKQQVLLRLIISNPQPDLIKLLLASDLTPDSIDQIFSETVRHDYYEGLPHLIELFIQYGATQSGKDRAFVTAAHYVEQQNTAKQLSQHGITQAAKDQALAEIIQYQDCPERILFLLSLGITQEKKEQLLLEQIDPDIECVPHCMEALLQDGISQASKDKALILVVSKQFGKGFRYASRIVRIALLLKSGITQETKDRAYLHAAYKLNDADADLMKLFHQHHISTPAKSRALFNLVACFVADAKYDHLRKMAVLLPEPDLAQEEKDKAFLTASKIAKISAIPRIACMKLFLENHITQETIDEAYLKAVHDLDYRTVIAFIQQHHISIAVQSQALLRLIEHTSSEEDCEQKRDVAEFLLRKNLTQEVKDKVLIESIRRKLKLPIRGRLLNLGITQAAKNEALRIATKQKHKEVVNLLLEARAIPDPPARNAFLSTQPTAFFSTPAAQSHASATLPAAAARAISLPAAAARTASEIKATHAAM